ncbi:MAG: hypothetical protein IKC77_01495 [Lentisphaeria bacterium]|nr:hypothetical protein [Lentisphaeria bacterium]
MANQAYYISGGEVNTGEVLHYDSMFVYSGGTAENTTLSKGGYIEVSSGGVVNSAQVDLGDIYVFDGGLASGANVLSGGIFVSAGGSADATVMQGGQLHLIDAASATSTTVSGGDVHVSSGASLTSTTMMGGDLYVSSGGTAEVVDIKSGGSVTVNVAATVSGATLSAGGYLYIASGTNVSGLEWKPGDGYLWLAPGAEVGFTSNYTGVYYGSNGKHVWSSAAQIPTDGNLYSVTGSMYVMNTGSAYALSATQSGQVHVWGGGKAAGVMLEGPGARLFVSGGAKVYGAGINGMGTIEVYSGGSLGSIKHLSGNGLIENMLYDAMRNKLGGDYGVMIGEPQARLYVSGGYAENVMVTGGASMNMVAGSAQNVKIHNGGNLHVSGISESTKGVVTGIELVGNELYSSGPFTEGKNLVNGSTSVTEVTGGAIYVSNYGVISGTNAGRYLGGTVNIYSGGLVKNVDVVGSAVFSKTWIQTSKTTTTTTGSDGSVTSSDTVTSVTSSSYSSRVAGLVNVYNGGVLTDATVAGTVYVYSGGLFSNANVPTTNSNFVSSYKTSDVNSALSGGRTSVTTASNGSYGSAEVVVTDGGRLQNLILGGSGASVVVSSGGIIGGQILLERNNLTVERGGTIDFTVSEQKTYDDYLVRDLRLIDGAPSFSITVSDRQTNGTYKLAQGAEFFDVNISVTVGNGVRNFGSVKANNVALEYNKKFYSLVLEGSTLLLNVSSGNPDIRVVPYPTYTVTTSDWTTEDVIVSAQFANEGIVNEYSFDGKNWETYTGDITFPDNGIVYFRSKDAVGNYSQETVCVVDNIDKTAAEFSMDRQKAESYNTQVIVSVAPTDYQRDKDGNYVYVREKEYLYELDMYGNQVLDGSGNPIARLDADGNHMFKYVVDENGNPVYELDAEGNPLVEDGSGIADVMFSLDGKKTWQSGYNAVVTKNQIVYFRVKDRVGNLTEIGEYEVFTIGDFTGPTLTVDGVPETWITAGTESITLTATASDTASDVTSGIEILRYTFDNPADANAVWFDVTGVRGTETLTINAVVNENKNITFQAFDFAGNKTEQTINITQFDRVGPTITISGADLTDWTNQSIVVSATAVDDVSQRVKLEYSYDNIHYYAGTEAVVENNGMIYFKATDEAGNVTISSKEVIYIDKTAPTLEINIDLDVFVNEAVTVTATYNDFQSGLASIGYQFVTKEEWAGKEAIDDTKWISGDTCTVTANGYLAFKVADKAGNITVDYRYINIIDDVAPTISSVTPNTTEWTPEDVILTIEATDDHSGAAKVFYRFNENSAWSEAEIIEVIEKELTAKVSVPANGEVYLKLVDNAGNETETIYRVSNIDKEKPVVKINGGTGDVWTKEDVTLTAETSDDNAVVKTEYSFDNINWKTGTQVLVTDQATVYFKATDAAGNVTVESTEVLIDKDAPVITINGYDGSWTAEKVTVTALVSDSKSGVAKIECSYDNKTWSEAGIATATESGTIYFRATDKLGNVSTESIEIKIDQDDPTIAITGNAQEWTNKDVVLNVNAADNSSGVKQVLYSYDYENGPWLDVVDGKLAVSENGSVYFKVIDNVGKETSYNEIITKIDKVAPGLVLSGNATEWTNKDVVITAASNDAASGIAKVEYSFDNKTWNVGSSATVTANGTVYFRATDKAGNVTEKSENISKIDKAAPVITIANPDVWTNGSVTVGAVAVDSGSGLAKLEYSLDNKTWKVGDSVTVSDNGSIYFRATDNCGLVNVKEVKIDKIDKVAPSIEIAGNAKNWTKDNVVLTAVTADNASGIAKVEYSLDNKTWKTGSEVTAAANGTVYFKVTDEAGNIAEKSIVVDKIDKAKPVLTISGMPSGATRKDIVLTATASDSASGIAKIEYSFDNKTWSVGDSVTVTANGTVYFKATDNVGNTVTVSQKVNLILGGTPDCNLLDNGVSQIVGWDSAQGKVGFVATDGNAGAKWQGIWEWNRGDALMWKVVGVGHFAGSKVDHDGILLYNGFGNTFAAWTNLNDPSYGYVDLCHVDGNFNTKTLVNLDKDSYDDVLIYDEKGSFGVVLDGASYKDIWHAPENNQWELLGAGSFGADKADKLIVKNTNGHLYLWENKDASFKTWNWTQSDIGYLGNDWEFVAAGDFAGDGIDDIIVRKVADNALWMWKDGNSKNAAWQVTPEAGFKAEAVGDYNGDGKDDLLVREYNTGWGGLGYYAFGGDQLWNDLNARVETDYESKFAIIA